MQVILVIQNLTITYTIIVFYLLFQLTNFIDFKGISND